MPEGIGNAADLTFVVNASVGAQKPKSRDHSSVSRFGDCDPAFSGSFSMKGINLLGDAGFGDSQEWAAALAEREAQRLENGSPS